MKHMKKKVLFFYFKNCTILCKTNITLLGLKYFSQILFVIISYTDIIRTVSHSTTGYPGPALLIISLEIVWTGVMLLDAHPRVVSILQLRKVSMV